MLRNGIAIAVGVMLATLVAAAAEMNGGKMAMPMEHESANFAPTREAYTGNHLFLIKLLELPKPVPYEQYFSLRFAVYDAQHPNKELPDATLAVNAGMRHGKETGFAHGMESSPKIAMKGGVVNVSGMYFHMRGPWILEVTVHEGGREGTAEFRLPCCG
jgi:hypothetical protein